MKDNIDAASLSYDTLYGWVNSLTGEREKGVVERVDDLEEIQKTIIKTNNRNFQVLVVIALASWAPALHAFGVPTQELLPVILKVLLSFVGIHGD